MREILAERDFPIDELRLFASARSAGRKLSWNGSEIAVEDAAAADFHRTRHRPVLGGQDHVAGDLRAVVSQGPTVIDNSSAWRMDPDVPLVVPEVNAKEVFNAPKGIIANPNCTTMAAMPVLAPLHAEAGLVSMVAATYQAVSGAGLAGVDELDRALAATTKGAAALTFDGDAATHPAPDKFQAR